jgi:hypothetical protein
MPPRIHSPAERRAAAAEKRTRASAGRDSSSGFVFAKPNLPDPEIEPEEEEEVFEPQSLPNFVMHKANGDLQLMGKVASADHVRPQCHPDYLLEKIRVLRFLRWLTSFPRRLRHPYQEGEDGRMEPTRIRLVFP